MRPAPGSRPSVQDRRPGAVGRACAAAALLAAALLAGCAALPGPAAAAGEPAGHRCAQPALVVHAERRADAVLACEAAAASLGFLATMGAGPAPPIAIDIAARLPAGISASALAAYSKRTGRITVLRYDAFVRRGHWFKAPVDRELYRSVFAHEVAHAVAVALAGPDGLDTGAHEYIASVAMFATMSSSVRERVLDRYDRAGFSHDQQINSMVYAFDPEQFAVDAWRHFSLLDDAPAFLRRVLDGKALREPRALGD